MPAIGKQDDEDLRQGRGRHRHRARDQEASATRRSARCSRPSRAGGTEVKPKSQGHVLVSIGQPDVVFTNGKNILRINGATGGKFEPVAEDLGRGERTRRGTPPAPTSPTRPTAADAQERRQGELAAMPLRPAGEHTATSRGRRTRTRTSSRCARTHRQRRQRPLLRRDPQRRTDVNCKAEPGSASTARSTGRRTARRCSPSAPSCRRARSSSASCAGRSRTARPFSPNAADWNKGKFVSDIDTPARACSTRRSRPTASGSRSCRTSARRRSGCGWPRTPATTSC